MTDEALASRATDGDREAFARLFERYQRPIQALARRMGCGEDRSRDLAQDVFVRVLDRVGRFDPSRRFSSWIFRVAANLIRNDLEARGRWRTEGISDEPEDLAPRPEIAVVTDEEARRVREALTRVPEALRLVLLLYFQEERSHDEIGEILDITPNHARVRLFRGLRRLQKELGS